MQWRIHDFPGRGRQPQRGGRGHQPIIWAIFTENDMKIKKSGPRGRGVPYAPTPQDTPMQ